MVAKPVETWRYRPRNRRQPVGYIGTAEMAQVLGYTSSRIRQLLRAGIIRGERIQMPESERRWDDLTPRKTRGGDWRVPLDEWERFLRVFRSRAA